MPRQKRPVRSAAIKVVPDPRNASRTRSPGPNNRVTHRRPAPPALQLGVKPKDSLVAALGQRTGAGIFPDIGTVATVAAELNVISMAFAIAKNKYKFMSDL